jgi:hypothetical protein
MKLETAEGAIAFCHWVMAQMRETFLADGEYPSPDGYVLATCEVPSSVPGPGQKITAGQKLPEAIPVRMPLNGAAMELELMARVKGIDVRDVFAQGMQYLAKGTAACGVVVMMEMWYVTSEGVTPPPKKGRWFDGPVSEQPDRREGLLVTLDHNVAGSRHWFAEIDRNPTRLGQFVEKPFDRTEGRLTHLGVGVGS